MLLLLEQQNFKLEKYSDYELRFKNSEDVNKLQIISCNYESSNSKFTTTVEIPDDIDIALSTLKSSGLEAYRDFYIYKNGNIINHTKGVYMNNNQEYSYEDLDLIKKIDNEFPIYISYRIKLDIISNI